MNKQRLSYREVSSVCLELSLFLHAGASVSESMSLLADQTEEKKLKKAFTEIVTDLDAGKPLSAAMEVSGIFPDRVCLMLRAAEKTGKSEEMLLSASKFYDRLDVMDGQTRSALLYPSVLMAVMMAVAVLILVYVMPIFRNVYAALGGEPYGLAAILLSVGGMLKRFLPLICLLFVLVAVGLFIFSFSQNFRGKLFGIVSINESGISKKIASAHFARALSLAFSGGMDSVSAVYEAGKVLGSEKSFEIIEEVCKKASEGEDIWFLLKDYKILPAAEARLMSIGVEGGNAEQCAEKAAERLDRDADEAIEKAVSRIEPFMVIFSCAVIGAILLSVMIPLTEIISSIG